MSTPFKELSQFHFIFTIALCASERQLSLVPILWSTRRKPGGDKSPLESYGSLVKESGPAPNSSECWANAVAQMAPPAQIKARPIQLQFVQVSESKGWNTALFGKVETRVRESCRTGLVRLSTLMSSYPRQLSVP